jgi:hypothetical protein
MLVRSKLIDFIYFICKIIFWIECRKFQHLLFPFVLKIWLCRDLVVSRYERSSLLIDVIPGSPLTCPIREQCTHADREGMALIRLLLYVYDPRREGTRAALHGSVA